MEAIQLRLWLDGFSGKYQVEIFVFVPASSSPVSSSFKMLNGNEELSFFFSLFKISVNWHFGKSQMNLFSTIFLTSTNMRRQSVSSLD